MKKKLTLYLDATVVENARRYARQNGKHLSGLIEDYLQALTADNPPSVESTSKTSRFYGILAPLGQGTDTRPQLEEILTQKYLP